MIFLVPVSQNRRMSVRVNRWVGWGAPGLRFSDMFGAILGAIESVTCEPHMSVVPQVNDLMAPRMAPNPENPAEYKQRP
jgi:hypothetical protein